MIKTLYLFTFALLFFSLSAPAQAEVKDSFYFMKDDGIFSDEEKDEEAEYIYKQCSKNPFQKVYYDCTCIAGAFRVKRDAEKLIPQGQVLDKVFDSRDNPCVDTASIAGNAYKTCMEYSAVFRERKTNNKKYCGCVANKSALDFKGKPILRTRNLEKIHSNAIVTCARQYK